MFRFIQMYLEVSSKPCCYSTTVIADCWANSSAEWASGGSGAVIEWASSSTSGVRSHKFWKQKQSIFQEDGENAAWGNWYWSTGDDPGVSYKIGSDTDVRGQFLKAGALDNQVDNEFRAVNDRW
jgi:hypothetical protein